MSFAEDLTMKQYETMDLPVFVLNCQSICHYAYLFRKTIM